VLEGIAMEIGPERLRFWLATAYEEGLGGFSDTKDICLERIMDEIRSESRPNDSEHPWGFFAEVGMDSKVP